MARSGGNMRSPCPPPVKWLILRARLLLLPLAFLLDTSRGMPHVLRFGKRQSNFEVFFFVVEIIRAGDSAGYGKAICVISANSMSSQQ